MRPGDTLDYGLFYSASNKFKLLGYFDSDWAGDLDDRKSTTGFLFYLVNTAFTWSSKKEPIVTLSTKLSMLHRVLVMQSGLEIE